MSWESWERSAEGGPTGFAIKCGCFLFVACIILGLGGCVVHWIVDAGQVVREETAPRTLLRRYEWFKEAAAALDARNASIKVYEKRFADLKVAYAGAPRAQWSREDREQSNLWEQEVSGLRASFNNLAAEYNAAMAKINWAYCNRGSLPLGADVPLPREFKMYLEN